MIASRNDVVQGDDDATVEHQSHAKMPKMKRPLSLYHSI